MKNICIAALCLLQVLGPSDGRAVGRKPQVVGCIIGLNEHLPKKNEPLLLVRGTDKALSLAMPETAGSYGSVALREGEELVIACPGNRNILGLTQEDTTSGYCARENLVKIGKSVVSMDTLECKNRAAASVRDTGKSCAQGKGTVVEIGFKVEKWHMLVETCHNVEDSLTYYAKHTVYGSSLAGKVIQSFRPGFSRGDKAFFKGFSPDDAYNQNNQREVLETMFGKKGSDYLDPKQSFFLARGHLAPDADFLFGSWQLLTYFYINTAPQWQSINAGYWLGVENNVRRLATRLGADLDVVTGTYGVLKLQDGKGKSLPLYLQGKDRLPTPELFWKVVRNPQDNSCIALISTNNPFITEPPKTICKDVCAKYKWPILRAELNKGYVYCCEYAAIKKAIKYVPDFKCESGLAFA